MRYGSDSKRKDYIQWKDSDDKLSKLNSFISSDMDDDANYFIKLLESSSKEGIDNIYTYLMSSDKWILWKKQLEKKVFDFLDILFSDYKPRLKKKLLALNYPYELLDHFNRAIVNLIYNRYDLSCFYDEGKIIECIVNINADDVNNKIIELYPFKEIPFKFSNGIDIYPRFLNEDKYEGIEEKYKKVCEDRNVIYSFNSDEFFVYSEYMAYIIEKKYLKLFGLEDRVRWVSRYDGDRFHYDILSLNPEDNTEKMVEVKSTINGTSTCSLSSYEMAKFMNSKDCESYVYWFRISDYLDKNKKLYLNGSKRFEMYILKYFSNNNLGFFIDQNGSKYDIFVYDDGRCEIYETEEKVMDRGSILTKEFSKVISFRK